MLKDVVITEVNEMPALSGPAEPSTREPGYMRRVLRDGNERANAIASIALGEVRGAVGAGC